MFEQTFKNIDDVLWKEAGCATELDYTEQTSWILFLKYLDDLERANEQKRQLEGKKYENILDKPHRWSAWAAPKKRDGSFDHDKALTGPDLIEFVNRDLFPYLQGFRTRAEGANTIEYKIGEIFGEIKNKFQSGYSLRDALELIDALSFKSQEQKHELSHLYEAKLRNMGNAGRNGGEYYTPRPLIRAMIQVVKPKIGERIYDGACGSAGFLCESFEYMMRDRDALSTKDLRTLQEKTFTGKEKKSLAYILGIMNMILHGIEAPNIVHTNTLAENISDIQDKDRFDIVLANPPFGGKERPRERYRVKLFMDQMDQREKTLVFCATQGHALLVRDLINQMKTGSDPNYCVRVTADDGERGEQWLRTFQDNEKAIPTILTTSQKLSTGVDARNVRNIVLMRAINTMIEFKQIIGRGTRLFDGKDYFTIYDFVKAYEHFNDPEWDGEPMEPTAAKPDGKGDEKGGFEDDGKPDYEPPSERPKKIKITLADGKERTIQSMMATSYWSPDGKPISANQMIEKLFGELPRFFKDEDELRLLWSKPDTRRALLQSLAEKGFGSEQLSEISLMINAEKSDVFDVLAYIAFALAPITRSERVEARKGEIFTHYDGKLQAFLDFVLAQYVRHGVGELDQAKLGNLLELKYHTVSDAADQLGGVPVIRDTFVGFQQYLYRA
jgi:hypothetical protein